MDPSGLRVDDRTVLSKVPISSKLWWSFVACSGFLVSSAILGMRQRIMCPILELRPFEFLPLSGTVQGYDPHLLCRIMHDVTHPVPLLGLAIVSAWLATRPIFRSVTDRFKRRVEYGLALLHMAFLGSYFASTFLPLGT
jgi:hypothetical protein